MSGLTHQRAKEMFSYNPITGLFTRLIGGSGCGNRVGSIAGSKNGHGYIHIQINKKFFKAHRLAWFYMTGEWPKDQIDHKDGVRDNNAWGNLREADNRLNHENLRKANSTNKLGVMGVYKQHRKFVARIKSNGKKIHLGMFDTAEAAHAAYLSAKRKIHAGCMI